MYQRGTEHKPKNEKETDTMTTSTSSSARMTKRDYFNILRSAYPADAANHAEVIAFIDHELELLDRKNNTLRKPTATQQANMDYKQDIIDYMVPGERYTVTDLMKGIETLSEFSNQKVTALVRQLVLDGSIVKATEKGKSFFSLAE